MKNNKTALVAFIAVVFSLGLGVAIGMSLNKKDAALSENANNPASPALQNINWSELSDGDLSTKLSEVMLPEDEFVKLEAAIQQTATGLLMAQAQGAGITVNDETQQELKKSITEKYSRKYFADMNATSMKELAKPELIAILSFYNTEAGQKFLKLSPKIIQTTMTTVQSDLSAWLPKTVDTLVAKLKGGAAPEEKKDDAAVPAVPASEAKDEKAKS